MRLKILGSSSAGNCYVLEDSKGMMLIIEAGIRFSEVKKSINFKIGNVVGALISHSHGDHAKYAVDMMKATIDVFATEETHKEINFPSSHGFIIVPGQRFSLGDFAIKSFDLKHDVKCVGFLIQHSESGLICFITDTYYSEYSFSGVNNFIVEANYSLDILQKRTLAGENPEFLKDRVIQSHLSLENCKGLLHANDLSQVNNIVLIHLSDHNSDSKRFKKEIQELTGKVTTIAEPGLVMDLNRIAF